MRTLPHAFLAVTLSVGLLACKKKPAGPELVPAAECDGRNISLEWATPKDADWLRIACAKGFATVQSAKAATDASYQGTKPYALSAKEWKTFWAAVEASKWWTLDKCEIAGEPVEGAVTIAVNKPDVGKEFSCRGATIKTLAKPFATLATSMRKIHVATIKEAASEKLKASGK
jgi:hypothetical protein